MTFLKIWTIFIKICSYISSVLSLAFWPQDMWGPSSQARGMMSLALEGKVLTTGPPGKSLGKLKAGQRLDATIPGSTALCQPLP